jgi:hypothetical protein
VSSARLIAAAVACLAALAAPGCRGAGNSGPPAAPVAQGAPAAPKRAPGYPSSLAALGHSGSTTFSPAQRRAFGGTGPCDYLHPAGKFVAGRLRRLTRIISGYEAQLRAGGARVPRCRYDDGAFARQVHRRRYVSEDLNHFSIAGHAKAAAVAWSALRHAGLVHQPATEEHHE